MLYMKLAEEKRAPFYLSPQPVFVPKITSLYSILQQQQPQQQQQAHHIPHHLSSPPRPQVLPSNFILSPSTPLDLSRVRLGSGTTGIPTPNSLANSPGSAGGSSLVGNMSGISGLPTPGGSSVGTPSQPPYSSQLYPTSLLKFPFSPPTPSSFGLLSPWHMSNRSLSISSSVPTPGPASVGDEASIDPAGMLQCLAGVSSASDIPTTASSSASKLLASRESEDVRSPGSISHTTKESMPSATSSSIATATSQSVIVAGPGNWATSSVSIPSASLYQNTQAHLKSLQAYTNLASIRSPLGLPPYSPGTHLYSPYPGSVSSCPSVSSSSGCSSASESQDSQMINGSLPKGYILSEYHVGPHKMISEKLGGDEESEGTTNSGRNTPIELTGEDSGATVIMASK